MVEHPGFFLSQDDNPSRSVGEPLEHALVLLTCRAPVVVAGPAPGTSRRTPVALLYRREPTLPWSCVPDRVGYAMIYPTLHAHRVFPEAVVYAQSEIGTARSDG
ncbi:hypothetical protein GCM10009779_38850 [Polymorphospora rubra]|uniref:Uncharacterized protein n=1 Tax=Polymorphospora rubra TaxID=338584 RepID=A0A810MZX8_9ACTN|nr:hypothetical protein Prubr_30150 [Polymorphospora rubra]